MSFRVFCPKLAEKWPLKWAQVNSKNFHFCQITTPPYLWTAQAPNWRKFCQNSLSGVTDVLDIQHDLNHQSHTNKLRVNTEFCLLAFVKMMTKYKHWCWFFPLLLFVFNFFLLRPKQIPFEKNIMYEICLAVACCGDKASGMNSAVWLGSLYFSSLHH